MSLKMSPNGENLNAKPIFSATNVRKHLKVLILSIVSKLKYMLAAFNLGHPEAKLVSAFFHWAV